MPTHVSRAPQGALFSGHDLFVLIVPLLVEQVLNTTVGIADSMMIASVGEAAVSGVSLVDSVMILINNVFAALATGGAVVSGQFLGMCSAERAEQAGNQLVLFSAAAGAAVSLLLYLLSGFILGTVFGAIEPDVYAHARTYLLIVTLTAPFVAVYSAGAALFRTMGNSRVSMLISLIMNVVNIAGNAVLIFGLKWGVAGAAIPTLCSRILAAVLVLRLLYRADPSIPIRLHPEQLRRFDGGLIRRILGIGIPNGLENSMFQLGKILMLSLVSTFGTASIAANAVGTTVCTFQSLPGAAMGLAMVTVIARCVGAGDYAQVRYYTRRLMGICYGAMIVLNAAILLALPGITWLYHLSDETARLASIVLTIHGSFCMLIWPLSFTLPNTLRAAGDVRFCMLVAIVSMWVFRVGGGWLLATAGGFGMVGVWMAMILDWCFRTVLFVHRYRGDRWQRPSCSAAPTKPE